VILDNENEGWQLRVLFADIGKAKLVLTDELIAARSPTGAAAEEGFDPQDLSQLGEDLEEEDDLDDTGDDDAFAADDDEDTSGSDEIGPKDSPENGKDADPDPKTGE